MLIEADKALNMKSVKQNILFFLKYSPGESALEVARFWMYDNPRFASLRRSADINSATETTIAILGKKTFPAAAQSHVGK